MQVQTVPRLHAKYAVVKGSCSGTELQKQYPLPADLLRAKRVSSLTSQLCCEAGSASPRFYMGTCSGLGILKFVCSQRVCALTLSHKTRRLTRANLPARPTSLFEERGKRVAQYESGPGVE